MSASRHRSDGHEEIVALDALPLSAAIRRRELSCREVMQAYLAQIERFNPRVNAIVGDGRASLAGLGTYDVIMVDAYSDITPPFQMATVEFFSQVKAHLNANGVMVVNMNMRDPGPGGLNNYLSDTIGQVFSTIDTIVLSDATNQELFASDNPRMWEQLSAGLALGQQPALERFLQRSVAPHLTAYTPGDLVLTDDKAPVEILGIRSLDAIIQSELDYYHRIFKEQGMSGVMSSL